MRRTVFTLFPASTIGRGRPFSLNRAPSMGIIAGLLVLGLLAVSLYIAPTIAPLGLGAIGLGLPLLLLVWLRPEFGLLAIIFLTASFIPADFVDVRVPIGGGLELRDLALVGVLGLLGFRELTRKTLSIPWWPVGPLLALFLGFAFLSGLYALFFQNVGSNWAFSELRVFLYYAIFFISAWAITRRRSLVIMLVGLFVLADLTAGIVILQQLVGTRYHLLAAMSGSNWQISGPDAFPGAFGAIRIVPPGHTLMYFMMIVAFCLMLFAWNNRRLRSIAMLQFVFLNVGLLLTYTRAQWLAAVIALGFIVIILVPTTKARLGQYVAFGLLFLLLAVVLLNIGLQENIDNLPLVNTLVARGLSIFSPGETLETLSLQWRLFENEEALRSISENPLLGVGLGNSYRDVTLLRGEARGRYSGGLAPEQLLRFTRYIHNSYLLIATKMGLPALFIFLGFCTALLLKGLQLYRSLSDQLLRAMVLAVVAGFLGLLLWSVFEANLVATEGTSVVGLLVGLLASVQYLRVRGCDASPDRG